MDEEITWEISSGQPAIADKVEKMAFVEEVPITDDMGQGQRLFASNYNEMRSMLLKYKLMKTR
ncbi:hypothetical protein [Paenibacillus rigui]|uniref:Uncharacterized protein n=1 Tax=Paenibacillus rigui TaxID=554312 RepID=A0A229UKI3_9BACL|nr:hypothetical protein [Paenibacillus rigui]OXM83968.1 hypothetical protein CF651_22915 [Paenibacillus rigui]